MTSERFWARADSSETLDAMHAENETSMTLYHWQKLCRIWTTMTAAYWLVLKQAEPRAVSLLTRTSGAFHRSYNGVHSTLRLCSSSEWNANILKRGLTVMA